MIDAEQYILIASGNGNSMLSDRYVIDGATTPVTEAARSTLLAFKVGGDRRPPEVAPLTMPRPDFPQPDPELAVVGEAFYEHTRMRLAKSCRLQRAFWERNTTRLFQRRSRQPG